MPLSALSATDERLASPELVGRERDALGSCGRAVVLVPSFAQALEVQRALAAERGLSLGVTVSTPAAWARERWEVWGDGRRVVDGASRDLLAARVLRRACWRPGFPLADTPGTAALLADLSRLGMPWLTGSVEPPEGATEAECALVGLLPDLDAELRASGLVEGCEVMDALPGVLAAEGVAVPPVTVAGFPWMGRAERTLVEGLAATFDVAVVGEPATASGAARSEGLAALLATLFHPSDEPLAASGAVRMLLPAGPSAAPELVCRAIADLAGEGCHDVVVVARDASRAWRELSPRLAARGVSARAQLSCHMAELEPGRAFLGYARAVARLSELDETWPANEPVADAPRAGTVRVTLGDMSWWPPRDLSDFLVSSISHLNAARARRLDAEWRGNRLLTPGSVLEQLASPRSVSPEVAAATRELLRGRLGSAASKLLMPFVDGDASDAPGAREAVAALGAVLDVARTLKELGVSADPSQRSAVALSELVDLAEAALGRDAVVLRPERTAPGDVTVRIVDATTASHLAPASSDALVLLDQTSADAPVSEADDALSHILCSWGVEEPPSAMERERARFAAIARVPRRVLALERTLFGTDGKECYPSVMLSEVMACFGLGAGADVAETAGALGERNVLTRSESSLAENVSATGVAAARVGEETPAPAGRIDARERELVSPPPEGADAVDPRPVLSASQIESYLECPYKWFSLRRLRLRDADALFTGAEMGTFAHRVLEVSRRELVARARERADGGRVLADLRAGSPDAMQQEPYRDEVERLLALAQQDPAARLPGSAPDDAAELEEARAVFEEEFDAHLAHQYQLVGGRRPLPQALVPHLAREHGQLAGLRRDLGTLLDFEAGVLAGFEPRFFEWGFGRGSAPKVEYAGVLLTGTVDRIDVDAHGQVAVVDYKHKSDDGFAREYDAFSGDREPGSFSLPRRVQSLIYAQVVRRAFPDLTVRAALYLCTKGDHALAGAVDENLADLVLGEGASSRRLASVAVPRDERFGRGDAAGMEALLDASEDQIAQKMERLLAGDIEASPLDAEACRFCPVLNCERRLRK